MKLEAIEEEVDRGKDGEEAKLNADHTEIQITKKQTTNTILKYTDKVRESTDPS